MGNIGKQQRLIEVMAVRGDAPGDQREPAVRTEQTGPDAALPGTEGPDDRKAPAAAPGSSAGTPARPSHRQSAGT